MIQETNEFARRPSFQSLYQENDPLCLLSVTRDGTSPASDGNNSSSSTVSTSMETGLPRRSSSEALLASAGILDITNILEAIPCLARQDAPRRRYISETVTDAEVDQWWHIGRPLSERFSDRPREEADTRRAREILASVRSEINQHGTDPITAVVDAMRANRVLIWGEHHASPNPNREVGAQAMRRLREAGATHLAIEVPTRIQPQLDEFMRTGRIDPNVLPRLLRTEDYLNVLRAAREAGLQIVATDLPERTADVDRDRAARDPHMVAQISRILDANRDNRVVFWVGARHGREGREDRPNAIERASGLLRRNYSVASVLDQMGDLGNGILCYMAGDTAHGVERPVAIRTRDARTISNLGVYNGLISNPLNPSEDTNQRYGQWDMVIMYPRTPRRSD